MSDHPLPVTPEVGDTVRIHYRLEQARLAETEKGYKARPVKTTEGEVERIAEFHGDPRRRATGYIVRTAPDRVVFAPVSRVGPGHVETGHAWSINFDGEGSVKDLEMTGVNQVQYRAAGSKTRQVNLGRIERIELMSVGG